MDGNYIFDEGGECRFFLDSDVVDQLAESLSSGGVLTNNAKTIFTYNPDKETIEQSTLEESSADTENNDEETTVDETDGSSTDQVRDRTLMNANLDLEKTGLTKDALRDLILASYVTQATDDTVVGIEIPENELDSVLKTLLDSYVAVGEIPLLSQLEGVTNFTSKLFTKIGLADFGQDNGGSESEGSRWGYFRFGRFYYYKVQVDDGNGNYVYKYYLAEKGTIQIRKENANGELEKIKCYDQNTFNSYIEWFNGNGKSVNEEQAGQTYINDVFYTVPEIGKIVLVTVNNSNGNYSFSKEEIDYATDTEISNCTVDIQLLVDFLNISASSDFLTAFEELIKDQEIILQLVPETTTTTTTTTIEQKGNPSAILSINAHYDPATSLHTADEQCESGYTETITQAEEFDQIEIKEEITEVISNTTYDLVLKKANTWYFSAEREVTTNIVTESTTPESADVPGYTISKNGNEAFNDDRLGVANIATLHAKLSATDLKERIMNALGDKIGYIINVAVSSLEVDSTKVEVETGTKTITTRVASTSAGRGAMEYNDNTDTFLGLWKNKDGEYHQYANYNPNTGNIESYNEEALFDPNGKKVGYYDLYGDDDAYVADLFENADEELFELLDLTEHTQQYVPIMKYILYRYNGKDYGVTSFEALMRLLGLVTVRTGDYNVNTKSTEGAKLEIVDTDDGVTAEQHLIDGINNVVKYKDAARNYLPYVDTLIALQEKYGVNAAWIVAQGCLETGGGSQGSGPTNNNWYGLGYDGVSSYNIYNSPEECFEDMAKTVAQTGPYFKDGRETITDISYMWVNGKEYDPSTDDASNWWYVADGKETVRDILTGAGIDVSTVMGGEILQVCQAVTDHYNAIGAYYSVGGDLIWNNIEACWDHRAICCATYVSMVLYQSGLLTADQINEYNYHYTGPGGIPNMLQAAGWQKVPFSEIQPGDVLNSSGYHVMIYAGNGMVYDQNTCTGPKYGTAFPDSTISSYTVWRAP